MTDDEKLLKGKQLQEEWDQTYLYFQNNTEKIRDSAEHLKHDSVLQRFATIKDEDFKCLMSYRKSVKLPPFDKETEI